jgi:MYXO-CTERM domain-containing protein
MKSVPTMNTSIKTIGKVALCGVCAVTLLQTQANGQTYTLTDGTSSAVYSPGTVGGMTEWNVGGQDHLASQSFWVRSGSDTREISLDEILLSSSGSGNSASATFATADYQIDISYALTSLSLDRAQIVESISLQNLSGAALDLSFFQYNNFDLGANGGGDYARIIQNATTGLYSIAQGVEPGVASILEDAEVQANPGATRGQVGFYSSLFDQLENASTEDLSNYLGPIGPGNVEFAFQWDYTIEAGQTELISKVKTLDVTLIPEPTAAALALLGLGAFVSRRFTKRG